MGVSVCKSQRKCQFLRSCGCAWRPASQSFPVIFEQLSFPRQTLKGNNLILFEGRRSFVGKRSGVLVFQPSRHNNAGQWTFQKLICAALSQPLFAVKLLLWSWDSKLLADSAATQIKHNVVLKPDFSFEGTWMKYPKIILRWHKVFK